MTLQRSLFLLFVLLSPALAQDRAPRRARLSVVAEDVSIDKKGVMVFDGRVRVRVDNRILRAERLERDPKTGVYHCPEGVSMVEQLGARSLRVDAAQATFDEKRGLLWLTDVTFSGDLGSGSAERVRGRLRGEELVLEGVLLRRAEGHLRFRSGVFRGLRQAVLEHVRLDREGGRVRYEQLRLSLIERPGGSTLGVEAPGMEGRFEWGRGR